VLVGTTYLIGKEAVGDWLTAAVAVASLLAITLFKKLPEPVVILAGGVIGLLAH
jgi:chromate transporter